MSPTLSYKHFSAILAPNRAAPCYRVYYLDVEIGSVIISTRVFHCSSAMLSLSHIADLAVLLDRADSEIRKYFRPDR